MQSKSNAVWVTSLVAVICLVSPAALAAATPEDTLAQDVKIILGKSFNNDWQGLDQIPGIKWAPMPPTMLTNCMPDGGCFARQGTMTVAGRSLTVLASGARTMVVTCISVTRARPSARKRFWPR